MRDDRPLGPIITDWTPPIRPHTAPMFGRYTHVKRLTRAHLPELYESFTKDSGAMWDYMPVGPFADYAEFEKWGIWAAGQEDPYFHTIFDEAGKAAGFASYLRITPDNGVIEIGYIAFAPQLQRSRAATEAMALMMARIFELGYRRYEWKCNALNAPSRRAAERLGFSYEGTFRQMQIVKGRNRDTAWFSILDSEWPAQKARFDRWLSDENFEPDGQQRRNLQDF